MHKLVVCLDGPCAGESHIVQNGQDSFEVRVYAGPGQYAKATYAVDGFHAQIQWIVPENGDARAKHAPP